VWRSCSCRHRLCSPGGTPAPATEFSMRPCRCSMVHEDCSGAMFSTAPSCPPAAILSLHYTRAPLASSRNFPPGRPWTPMISCFKCFRCMFSSASFGCCVYCNGYIRMLQAYVSCYKHMFQVFQTYVSGVSSVCCRNRSGMLHNMHVAIVCFHWMLHILAMVLQVF
jgi:hypothetical protein